MHGVLVIADKIILHAMPEAVPPRAALVFHRCNLVALLAGCCLRLGASFQDGLHLRVFAHLEDQLRNDVDHLRLLQLTDYLVS